MLRQVLPPLVTAYAVFVAMVVLSLRRRAGRGGGVVGTIAGGYVAFLAIVLVFHVWLAQEPDAFVNAVWGGAFLAGVALVVASVSSLIGGRR